MLGELDESTEAVKKWRLIDITGGGSRDYYTGESRVADDRGHGLAIRDAFRNFAENNPYGRGTIAIRLPPTLSAYAPYVDAQMRSTKGAGARALQRLQDLATVAEIAGLFVTGPLGLAVGAVGGVAGAIVAVDSLARRSRTDHLIEVGTVFDILGVVGGVASVGGVGAGAARLHVDDLAAAGGRLPSWVNRLERTERALHIHGVIGNVQQVFAIPWQMYEQLEQIQQQLKAGTISEGQARAPGRWRSCRASSRAPSRSSRRGAGWHAGRGERTGPHAESAGAPTVARVPGSSRPAFTATPPLLTPMAPARRSARSPTAIRAARRRGPGRRNPRATDG